MGGGGPGGGGEVLAQQEVKFHRLTRKWLLNGVFRQKAPFNLGVVIGQKRGHLCFFGPRLGVPGP